MVQSPSRAANWFAASQEIPRISRNPKVHYRTHKCPPPVRIVGQPNPVHIPTPHLLEIHPNIIHPSTPRSPHWSLSLRFPHQEPIDTTYLNVNPRYFNIVITLRARSNRFVSWHTQDSFFCKYSFQTCPGAHSTSSRTITLEEKGPQRDNTQLAYSQCGTIPVYACFSGVVPN